MRTNTKDYWGVMHRLPERRAWFTGGFLAGANLATGGVGTSGIIVDNNASTTTFPQAASVYFNALQENANCNNNTNGAAGGGCAVKLTQSNLQ